MTFGKNTVVNPNTWSDTIEGTTMYSSGNTIMLTQPGKYQFYEVESENEYYLPCSKTEEGKKEQLENLFYNRKKKEITLNNKIST